MQDSNEVILVCGLGLALKASTARNAGKIKKARKARKTRQRGVELQKMPRRLG